MKNKSIMTIAWSLLAIAIAVNFCQMEKMDRSQKPIGYCLEVNQTESHNFPKLKVTDFRDVISVQYRISWEGGALDTFDLNEIFTKDPEKWSIGIKADSNTIVFSAFPIENFDPISLEDGDALIKLTVGYPFLKYNVTEIEFGAKGFEAIEYYENCK